LSADIGLGKTPGASSPAGSPTVPASAYDRNLQLSPAYRYYSGTSSSTVNSSVSSDLQRSDIGSSGSDLRRRPGSLRLESPFRRSLRYPSSLSGPDRLRPFRSGSTDSVKRNDLLGFSSSNATRSGSISDYKLSSFDKKLRNKRFIRDNFRGDNPGNIDLFQGPVSSETQKFSRRLDRLAARGKKIDDEFSSKSRIYTNQDRALSREAKLDVNLMQETSREKVFKNDLLAESLVLPESEQIEKALTPDEIRQKLSEMLALEKLQEKQTDKFVELFDNMKNKDDADKSEESKQDAGKKDSNQSKFGPNAESDAPRDPLTGIMPSNIDYKLQESRQIITKIKDFQAHVDNKFTTYMTTADKCIVEGEYYKAMSTYDIASVWKSDDSRPYAGKAFAHLAVGEYFDSSRFLIRAIESSGDFAAAKTDVAATIGNKKLYDKHLTKLKSMFEVDGDYRKAFLLAYLYTQEGDFAKAKECVDYAAPKMAKIAAWKSLSKVIEERLAITK